LICIWPSDSLGPFLIFLCGRDPAILHAPNSLRKCGLHRKRQERHDADYPD
jgi:hypothetical protein